MTEAESRERIPPTQVGDSGAPYFTVQGPDRVTAKGTHTGLNFDLRRVYYQDFAAAINLFGIRLR